MIFPKRHRKGAKLPDHLVTNRACLICGHFGCVPKLITAEDKGGQPTGDNLLPVCRQCARAPFQKLYREHSSVKRWCLETDRLDVVLEHDGRL